MYSRTNLKTNVATMISGTITDTALSTLANRAVREVLMLMDLRSAKRHSSLSPGLCDDIYDYSCPTDLKAMGIIDIKPQINRNKNDQWRLTTGEEFDRLKGDEDENLVTLSDNSMVRKLRLSRHIDDQHIVIDSMDSVGDWVLFGDGTNLTQDVDNRVKGVASINWDISAAGGTTAGIYNASLDVFDISDYLTNGSIFVWVYISSATYLTNFILRVGSSSSNYYSMTATTNNEGTAFVAGWNLIRFDFSGKSETGTVDPDACVYAALYMTKNALKISETDYRFDNLVMKMGERYDVIYYSKYGWQSAAGTFLEDSTADTDLLNYDTDEINLIEHKMAELGERYLRNQNEANNHLTLFTGYSKDYLQRNPSEALLMTTTYHFI
jgi:hypothetical protein